MESARERTISLIQVIKKKKRFKFERVYFSFTLTCQSLAQQFTENGLICGVVKRIKSKDLNPELYNIGAVL